MAIGRKKGLHCRLRDNEECPEVATNLPSQDDQDVNITNMDEVQEHVRKKRGPTKMKTLAMEGASRIEVQSNGLGQLIGEGSVSLSSFLGPLVREIVPYTISNWRKIPSDMHEILWKCIQARYIVNEGWQKDYIFKEMGELWRASKSRIVSKLRKAPNEEEMVKLRPGNIKTTSDWKEFLKLKNSADFKSKSRGNQTVPRVDVWVKAHERKDGTPINTKAAETIEKLQKAKDDPSVSKTNLKEDALSKILGFENRGRVRGLDRGVTFSQLSILSQRDNTIAQMKEEQNALKDQVESLTAAITALLKNQASQPYVAKKGEAFLWRPTSEMTSIEEAVGSTIAWPADKVDFAFAN
ncbi:hypothetical protein Q3G72_012891 [Acer saccharum]|nr:hypothetical protein Q3G72_012891 [Acer saccharum]